MRRMILCLILIIVCQTCLYGQRSKEILLAFDKDDFLYEETPDGLAISSFKHPIQYSYDPSEPGIPYVICHILIGNDEEYAGMETECLTSKLFQRVEIRKSPDYLYHDGNQTDVLTHTLSYVQYPIQNVRYTGTHEIDGYRYLSFLVCPFQYSLKEKELDLCGNVRIKINVTKAKTAKTILGGSAMYNVIRKLVINGDDIDLLYTSSRKVNGKRSSLSGLNATSSFDYLIITSDSLKAEYQELADWKMRKGVPARIITLEHIDSFYTGYSNLSKSYSQALAIKRAIEYYKNYHDIKYVLLGGDYSIIPSPFCFHRYDSIGKYVSGTTPCDLYYACVGGEDGAFEWNWATNDGYIGTFLDRIDYHPQVHLTRLSTNSVLDARIQIKRILEYERNPTIGAWRSELLMTGCEFSHTNFSGRFKSDVEEKGEKLWIKFLQSLWSGSSRYRFYDTWTDHPLGADYDVTALHLNEQLSHGYPFIHLDTHGSADSIKMENCYYYKSDAYNFVNPFYSIIITSACSTNAFDEPESLSEALMRNPNSGIIGYWGHSRSIVGLDDETNLSAIDLFNLRFYTSIFDSENPRFGEAASLTKLAFIAEYDNYHTDNNMPYSNPYRTFLFTLNPLGDPEMPIYTRQPQEFHFKDFYFENDSVISLNFTHTGLCTLCIMSLDDNGKSYYSREEVQLGNPEIGGVTLNLPKSNNYSLCFTKAGYKPYVLNLYRNGFIQNDKIANDAIALTDQIQIGRDVTTALPTGAVSAEQGEFVIRAPHGTIIKNSFELKKGATLTIDSSIEELTDVPDE